MTQGHLDLGPEHARVPGPTEDLAARAGLPVERFVAVFGAGWRALEDAADGEPWFVAGEPFQLALRVQGTAVELGTPVGRVTGGGSWRWSVQDRHAVPLPDLENADLVVSGLLRRRRSSFRYCHYCRRLTGPEERYDATTCHACASTWRDLAP